MRFVIWLGLFFFIYSPYFYVGNVLVKVPQVIVAVLGLAGLPLLVKVFRKYRLLRSALFVKLFGGIVLGFTYILHDSIDPFGLKMLLSGFAALSAALVFVALYQRYYKQDYQLKLLLHIFYVGIVHGALMIANMAYPSVNAFLLTYLYHSDKALASLAHNVRVPGILFEGFSILSVSQAMTYTCGLGALMLLKTKGVFRLLTNIIGSFVVLFSIFLCGRLGLVVFISSALAFIYFEIYKRNKQIAARPTVRLLFVLCGIVAFVMFIVSIPTESSRFGSAINRTFSIYHEYRRTKSIEDPTYLSTVDEKYFLPEGVLNNVLGTGGFRGYGKRGPVGSDVGYICMIFGSGLIGMLVVFSFFGLIGYQAFRLRKGGNPLTTIVLVLSVSVFVINLKDVVLYKITGFSQVLYICYLLMIVTYYDATLLPKRKDPRIGYDNNNPNIRHNFS